LYRIFPLSARQIWYFGFDAVLLTAVWDKQKILRRFIYLNNALPGGAGNPL